MLNQWRQARSHSVFDEKQDRNAWLDIHMNVLRSALQTGRLSIEEQKAMIAHIGKRAG